MKKKRAEFNGPLATPVKPRRTTLGMFLDPASAAAETNRRFAEDWEKLMLLSDHFGTPRQDFYLLALALARRFVPGFKEQTKKGARSKWTDLSRAVLVVEMERVIVPGNKSKGAAWAAKQLARRAPWSTFIRKNEDGKSANPGEVLRAMYQNSKELPIARLALSAHKFNEAANKLDEWESFVRDCLEQPLRTFDDSPQ